MSFESQAAEDKKDQHSKYNEIRMHDHSSVTKDKKSAKRGTFDEN
jgi:hypothetical protein